MSWEAAFPFKGSFGRKWLHKFLSTVDTIQLTVTLTASDATELLIIGWNAIPSTSDAFQAEPPSTPRQRDSVESINTQPASSEHSRDELPNLKA
ncbi:hypothetical protein CEXT_451021 [Caerostris extrusa]|uniref:Uncharacterized protein n=1 Tax=Caerostris extrusa TaxID=172846 RepID=A0AAV4MGT9_CAEEX|nr:hypothetical protein CEXT_451021 [Caerostris extrusa]